MDLLRGEIWWVDLDPTQGSEINEKRPCVVLSVDVINRHRKTVVVVPLSTGPSAWPPLTVAVNCNGRASVAVMDQLRAASKQRFGSRISAVNADEMEALEDALREILGML